MIMDITFSNTDLGLLMFFTVVVVGGFIVVMTSRR